VGRHRGRAPVLAVLLVGTGSLLAACSSPGQSSSSTTTTTTPSSNGTPSLGTTPTTTTTLPPASTSGALQISASLAIPITANGQVTATEAPDGAVFVAPESHDSPNQTVVWVIDGNGPAAIAEHISGGVSALAADATNLYVTSNSTVFGFTRSTGNPMGQWNLPPISTANTSDADLVSMSAANGVVLVMVSRGNLEDVYRIRADSTAAPTLIAQGSSAAFGPDSSVYYERADNRLVKLSGAGVTTVGPSLPATSNSEGGGIASVNAVAGGLVWVIEPAGQGLDAQWRPYSAATLQAMGPFSGSVTELIVDTSAGPLVLTGPDGPGNCPQASANTSTSCVFRISSGGTLSDPTLVGSADELLGPEPAVVTASTTGTDLVLDRLS
jgi:hypothetical protein